MRFVVFQHGECEHPGIFRRFFEEDGIAWDVVELDRGGAIPALEPYDAMLVMGGWMEPWDDANHPWLAAERRVIAHWVNDLQRPFLGVCLGHLLLAAALGGKSTPLKPVEIGICDIELTAGGKADPIYAGTSSRQKCLQWHSAEVSVLPPGDETIPNWGRLPDYAEALAKELGPDGFRRVSEMARPLMAEFHEDSRQVYRSFMKIARD